MPVGFILQPTYRVEAGRPVVHLYGRLDSGETFLLRDTRQVPCFWIRASDAAGARDQGAVRQLEEPRRRTMRGEALVRVEVEFPSDVPPLRQRLSEAGIEPFEPDVRFAYRYLIDRGIRGALEILGPAHPGQGVEAVFQDPDVRPAAWAPHLSVLSLDIETDPSASRVLSVAISGCGVDEVLLVAPDGDCPGGAVGLPGERELLAAFVRRVREIDPDVLTGWNVVLAVLLRRARSLGLELALGRGPEPLRLRSSRSPGRSREALLAGRLVMDGIDLLRGAFVRIEDYSLNGAAREILGKEKTIAGRDRAARILHAYRHDRRRFVEYNRADARLVLEILERLHLIELCVRRSLLTGLPPDRVAASIAAFDFLYLSALSRRGLVAPAVRPVAGLEAQTGGHVLEPVPGLHRNVVVLDFRSLYPAVIRTFQIDPLGRLDAPAPRDDPIVAPNGAAFSREPGILPGLLDDLFPRREAALASGDRVAAQAIKILMNSFYGVLGTPACRFASPALANAITGFGREILLWCRGEAQRRGHRVVYGDTDSLFVVSGTDDVESARRLGESLARELGEELAHSVRKTWRVESRLELRFERLYLRLFLPALRHGAAGARKRYVGLADHRPNPRVEFVGMESVRRDWTDLARRVQRELYERLFSDRPVEEYLRRTVSELRAGNLDGLLVYRKALRRRLESYIATTPPHVAAARKSGTRPGRMVAYVVTRDGPEPAAERHAPIDHEHYVQKQVRAVAAPVLALLGLDFDRVVGDDRQMELF
jgi:DNA polymerase-2